MEDKNKKKKSSTKKEEVKKELNKVSENIDDKSNKENKKKVKTIDKEEVCEEKEHSVQEENIKEKNKSENSNEIKKGFNNLEVVIIMFITLCFGCLLGSAFTYAFGGKSKIITTVPSELNEFISTYEDIIENYYDEIDEKGLLDAGIKGMLNFLGDKYSVYMDEEQSEDFNQEIEGKYVGIGSEIRRLENGDTIISDPFVGGPAYNAGLQVNDIILKVDGESIEGLTLEEVSNKVKGKAKTEVTITIKRDEEELDIVVTRDEVEITSVTSKVLEVNNQKVGYIDIEIFAENSANQFEKELLKLEAKNIDSLIIDVRDNSGGYLSTVEEIASLFLEKGKTIYQLDTKGIVEEKKDTTKAKRDYPVAVLINEYSASASEILASAIKEAYENGEVIGVNSYGKGTVQKAYNLSSGATVKYTIQKWLTPNGNWINEKGVDPTTVVEQSDAYYENPTDENDDQLQAALKILTNSEETNK